MTRLADPIRVGSRSSPSRVVFGPHETNLGRGRGVSERHVAYYARRAAGGCGVLVTETASVHPSDWPSARAPLAASCGEGWRAVAQACAPFGTLVLAGIGHCGGQGTSAYSDAVLWAPSPVPDPATREMPAEMEEEEIAEVVAGFEAAAAVARESGLAGVELDAGPRSLLRQFRSPLTNRRTDRYGADRLAFCREALVGARRGVGGDGVVALRLCCDELAAWGGITPEGTFAELDELVELCDLVVVVRGGPFALDAYRPGAQAGEGFNRALARRVRDVVAGRAAVVLQGSVVEVATAEAALGEGAADLVEMTRAQIAEPRLVALVRAGTPERARPCVLCNQACAVRDPRDPPVSCIGEPSSGYETVEAPVEGVDAVASSVLVVGGGPAGLECARVLAGRGHEVRLLEASSRLGGALARAAAGPGRRRLARLVEWLAAECRRLGAAVELSTPADPGTVERALGDGAAVVLATGSRPDADRLAARGLGAPGAPGLLDALAVLEAGAEVLSGGPVVVDDPVGGPAGAGLAAWLAEEGCDVAVVTPDPVVGMGLARTGDLAGANARLQRAGVRRELRARIAGVEPGGVLLEDVLTGERRRAPCATVVDCGHRLPEAGLFRDGAVEAGDCVAPRGVLEAVLEGRRRALEVAGAAPPPGGACPGRLPHGGAGRR